MASHTHHVLPNPDGSWDIKKEGGKRSSGHFLTKWEAIKKAVEIGEKQGSNVVIHSQTGQIDIDRTRIEQARQRIKENIEISQKEYEEGKITFHTLAELKKHLHNDENCC